MPLVIVAAAIAFATLWPTHLPPPTVTRCIFCDPLAGVDFIGNVVLFVPFGMAALRWNARITLAIVSGALFSGLIEAFQLQLVAGRDASLRDLFANSTGAAIGAWVASNTWTIVHSDVHHRRLWVLWSAAILAFAAASAWALAPERPTYVYWSQWTPVRTGYTAFSGSLDSLLLFGIDIPNGMPIDPTESPAAYLEGELNIRARFTSGPLDSKRALVARAGNPIGEHFQLAQHGSSLVFRARANAAHLGLRSPSVEFGSIFLAGAHHLEIDLDKRRVAARVDGAHTDGSPTRITPGYVWQIFMPFEIWSGTLHRVGACIFFSALFFPLGFWDRSRTGRQIPLRSVAVGAAALLVVPLLFGMSVAGWPEGLGAAAGIALGAALSWRIRRPARLP